MSNERPCDWLQVYTWGVNDEGALGREGDELEPTVVAGAIEGKRIIQIGCGDSHTVALAQDGTVYHWGIYRVCACDWLLRVTRLCHRP
jgi:hypothetical protein